MSIAPIHNEGKGESVGKNLLEGGWLCSHMSNDKVRRRNRARENLALPGGGEGGEKEGKRARSEGWNHLAVNLGEIKGQHLCQGRREKNRYIRTKRD